MFQIFKNAFKISYNNLIITTPLLLFLLILNVYLIIAKNAVKVLPSTILFFLTLLLMTSAFLAGWLYMIKIAVDNHINNNNKQDNNTYNLIKEFPVGIAEYIKPFLGFTLLYILFADLAFVTTYHIGLKFIGGIGVTAAQFISATEAPVAMQSFIESLTKTQLIKINYWYLLMLCSLQLFSLLTLFWPVELMYSTKNPILAFFKSVKIVFTKPQVILLFIGINIINFILMIFNYITMFNPITYFIMTVVFFSFIVYIFVLLFLYYEEKIQSNSDSSTNSNWEE